MKISRCKKSKVLLSARLALGWVPLIAGAASAQVAWAQPQIPTFLEAREGEEALKWVAQHNMRTYSALRNGPQYERFYRQVRELETRAESDPNIFGADLVKGWAYAIDSATGSWKRSPAVDYLSGKPRWTVILDVSQLNKLEGRNWALRGAIFSPTGTRALLILSNGGADSVEYREFDLQSGSFPHRGFAVPLAVRPIPAWENDNSLIVADALRGNGEVGANSAKLYRWRRGEPLSVASTILLGETAAGFSLTSAFDPVRNERKLIIGALQRSGQTEFWSLKNRSVIKLRVPPEVQSVSAYDGRLVGVIDRDVEIIGQKLKRGSLVAVNEGAGKRPALETVFMPGPRESVWDSLPTRHGLLAIVYRELKPHLLLFRRSASGWHEKEIDLPVHGLARFVPMAQSASDQNPLLLLESYVQPPALYSVSVDNSVVPLDAKLVEQPSPYVVDTIQVRSTDGEQIPYDVVRRKDLPSDKTHPTLLYGYGAHATPVLQRYEPARRAWLDAGGIYVVAHVRGGGEFGPDWAVRGADRHLTYADFIAVAEDLVRRRLTEPRKLGVQGMSSGGLLAAVAINMRPDLFNAAVIEVGMLDQLRPDLALGGDSGMTLAFGSTSDPRVRSFLEATSPFQNLAPKDNFPAPFVISATNDERVHPAQSRRYVARLEALKAPFYYLEVPSGGHDMSLTPNDRATLSATIYSYLDKRLRP